MASDTRGETAAPDQNHQKFETLVVLNGPENAAIVADIIRHARQDMHLVAVESAGQLAALDDDLLASARLVCVGGTPIVPVPILRALGFGAYNFHPGPPLYPGWAPFNFAYYDGIESYGTTVHHMAPRVDEGPIVSLDLFAVPAGIALSDFIRLTRQSVKRQLEFLAPHLTRNPAALPALPIPWSPRKTTKKLFAEKCRLTPDLSPAELARRIAAFAGGDGYAMPTLVMGGWRYMPLLPDQPIPPGAGRTVTVHGIEFLALDRVMAEALA